MSELFKALGTVLLVILFFCVLLVMMDFFHEQDRKAEENRMRSIVRQELIRIEAERILAGAEK